MKNLTFLLSCGIVIVLLQESSRDTSLKCSVVVCENTCFARLQTSSLGEGRGQELTREL